MTDQSGKKEIDYATEEVDFSDIYKGSFDSVGQLTELVGREIKIVGVEFEEISLGEVAIATVEYEEAGKTVTERRHTFSQVLVKQLKAIKPIVDAGKKVRTVIKKVKRYYTFT